MSEAAKSKLQLLREKRGLSRQQAAAALDISERTIIRHELGQVPIRRVSLVAYAELYGVAPEALQEQAVA